MFENEEIEFKKDYTDNIYKEIVSFLNSGYGTIYLGYDDDGNLTGLTDTKKIEEKISNGIKEEISPDCSVFLSINTLELNNKEFITIKVSKGIDVYYLKKKGILKGTYIRTGSCSIPCSEETVKQMIIRNTKLSFETSISNNQLLTFNYIKKTFLDNNIDIDNLNIRKNLHFVDDNNNYTNLALLFSDQNPYTIKLAVYMSMEKENFLDRKEFFGSVLELYDKVVDYLKLNSATYGFIDNSVRIDEEEFPEFILREIVLNSIIHRDYSVLTSNIINLYKDSNLEFISYGSLYGNITIDDILEGLSTTRNPFLQLIFMRLKRVEAIGSGLRRVNSFYKKKGLTLSLKALPSSFIVRLPKISFDDSKTLNDDINKKILDYTNNNGYITRKEAEKIINKEKTATVQLLNKLVSENYLIREGNGPLMRYVISDKKYK